MNISEFTIIIKKISDYFIDSKSSLTNSEKLLSRMVKISEEVGELSEQIMIACGHKDKTQHKEDIEAECADVIITICMLAEHLDINIEKALTDKISKLESKYHLDLLN